MPIFIGYYYTQFLILINPLQILQIFSQGPGANFAYRKGKKKILVKVVVESGDVSCSWVLGQKGSLLPTFTPVDSTVKVYSVNQQSKPQIFSIINPIIRDGGVVRDDFYEFFK